MSTPTDDSIPPDEKDWTRVIRERCEECGFDPAAVAVTDLGDRFRATLVGWPARLASPDARQRPAPTVWSPTEYAAHGADVARIMQTRLTRILAEDDPQLPNWDQDAAAVEGRYSDRDADDVATDLATAVASLAAAYDAVPEDGWERPGRRSNGSLFTARTLGLYALHDLDHHRVDVGI